MNIRMVAAAVIGSFVAVDSKSAYYVLTLDDDTKGIELGDILSGTFDGTGSLFYSVRNITRREDVRICLEDWECSVEVAIKHILGFMKTPGLICAGTKRLVSDADNVATDLRSDILKSGAYEGR
jgi:hypothetical protein